MSDCSVWKKSLWKPVSFTEPQIFINHCLLTKIYVERRKHTNGQRRERERKREAGRRVTVCDVLVTAVTHCNGCWFILHRVNITWHKHTHIYRPFWNTHTHSHTSMGLACVCDQQGSTSGFNTPGYKLFRYFNTLIYTFTDGNTVFMDHCCSDTCYGFNSFLCRPFTGVYSVLEWRAMIPVGADDVLALL